MMSANDPREEYIAREMITTNVYRSVQYFWWYQGFINLIKRRF